MKKDRWLKRKERENRMKNEETKLIQSIQGKPCHAHDNVEPPLLCAGILEGPHTIALSVPERTRCGVHAALSCVGDGAVGGGLLVDEALLDNGAIYGEAVRRRR